MGQYYTIINLTKKEYIRPHAFDDGAKIMEFGSSGDGTMYAFSLLMSSGYGQGCEEELESSLIGSWAGDNVIIAGDYSEPYKNIPQQDLGKVVFHCVVEELNREGANETGKETLLNWAEQKSNVYTWAQLFCKDISDEAFNMIKDCPFVQMRHIQTWQVPSSKGDKEYTVKYDRAGDNWSCTCPDFEARGHLRPCKHIVKIQNSR
jgi:hypothetical protein